MVKNIFFLVLPISLAPQHIIFLWSLKSFSCWVSDSDSSVVSKGTALPALTITTLAYFVKNWKNLIIKGFSSAEVARPDAKFQHNKQWINIFPCSLLSKTEIMRALGSANFSPPSHSCSEQLLVFTLRENEGWWISHPGHIKAFHERNLRANVSPLNSVWVLMETNSNLKIQCGM